ncbi:Cacna1c [Symbiodinium natans]|uniref:Cacna1c protein n=1 Tax=Symbiodinium natans TaxID=878477 RepID=A0A812JB45_9DINO|nr:Cacna1c [Symbiodinium natans]
MDPPIEVETLIAPERQQSLKFDLTADEVDDLGPKGDEFAFRKEVVKLRSFIDSRFAKQARMLELMSTQLKLMHRFPDGKAVTIPRNADNPTETVEELGQPAGLEDQPGSPRAAPTLARSQSELTVISSKPSEDDQGPRERPTLSRGSSKQSFVRSSVREQQRKAEEAAQQSASTFTSQLRRMNTLETDVFGSGPFRVFCLRVVTHSMFTNCIMFLILVNLILLGVEVDVATQLGQDDIPKAYGIANTLIVGVFLIEFFLKFFAFGCSGFFCGRDALWNSLDFIVIFSSVLETAVDIWDLVVTTQAGSTSGHFRIMRTMRLVRALRGIRVIRLLRYVSALRTLVFSIVSTMSSLFWTLVLLLLLFYSFGVIFTQLVSDYCREMTMQTQDNLNAVPECPPFLSKYWRSVDESMLTLFTAISGGMNWVDALDPLREVGGIATSLLILYIIVSVFAVLNVVTGVFCNTAIESAQSDKDIAIMKQMRKHDLQVQALRHIFKEIDHDKSNLVTLAELQEALSAKKLSSFLESMGISTQDVSTLFMIIDTDHSGWIDLDEFVSGCMQLHGPAKSLQLAQMSHENKVTRQVIRSLAKTVSAIRRQLESLTFAVEDARGTSHVV